MIQWKKTREEAYQYKIEDVLDGIQHHDNTKSNNLIRDNILIDIEDVSEQTKIKDLKV